MIIGLFFHILAAVIWVGGMVFAHFMLRPATGALDPALRLPLWERVLGRFFAWVWACVAALLLSGFAMIGLGAGGPYVDAMMGIGIIMMLIFAHLYFAPWRRFRRALGGADLAGAAAQLNQIRLLVTVNLVLGLVTVVIGATGPYWG